MNKIKKKFKSMTAKQLIESSYKKANDLYIDIDKETYLLNIQYEFIQVCRMNHEHIAYITTKTKLGYL